MKATNQNLRSFLIGCTFLLLLAGCGGGELAPGGLIDAGDTGGCSPSTCEGCCTEEGACITNVWNRQCGAGGEACVDCNDQDQGCNEEGQCVDALACNASNCAEGCCDGDECIEPGDSVAACGTGGAQCQTCDTEAGQGCDGTACRQPCGPDNCAGCCADEFRCIEDPDDPDAACGLDGEPCTECGEGEFCSDGGQCDDESCANTCEGCCTEEGTCIEEVNEEQCGVDGASCEACGSEEICGNRGSCISEECSLSCSPGCCDGVIDDEIQCGGNEVEACGSVGEACVNCREVSLWGLQSDCIDGECRLDPNSRWDVIIESAKVPLTDETDTHWDTFPNRPPDTYVTVTVGLGTDNERAAETPSASNDVEPDYDSFVIFEDVRAEHLMSEGQLRFDWADHDLWPNPDEEMSKEKPTQVPEEFFNGLLTTYTQRDFYEGEENSPLELVVNFRIVPAESTESAYAPALYAGGRAGQCSRSGTQVITAGAAAE